jgi:hypothetical protein
MDRVGDGNGMWDEEDGFFYDVLRLPDVPACRSRSDRWSDCSRSAPSPCIRTTSSTGCRGSWSTCAPSTPPCRRHPCDHLPGRAGVKGRFMLSILDDSKLRRVLARLLDPAEFLSDFGIRALSRRLADEPYEFRYGGERFSVTYRPAESDSGLFGGNSNWRGPIWLPVNVPDHPRPPAVYTFYGDEFRSNVRPARAG